MLESYITKSIINYAKSKGFLTLKIAGGRYQQPGISDIIACSPQGLFVAIEVKTPAHTPSQLQSSFLASVRACNGVGAWVTDLRQAKVIIDGILEYEATQQSPSI